MEPKLRSLRRWIAAALALFMICAYRAAWAQETLGSISNEQVLSFFQHDATLSDVFKSDIERKNSGKLRRALKFLANGGPHLGDILAVEYEARIPAAELPALTEAARGFIAQYPTAGGATSGALTKAVQGINDSLGRLTGRFRGLPSGVSRFDKGSGAADENAPVSASGYGESGAEAETGLLATVHAFGGAVRTKSDRTLGTAGVMVNLGYGSDNKGRIGPNVGFAWSGGGFYSDLLEREYLHVDGYGSTEIYTDHRRERFGTHVFRFVGVGAQSPTIAKGHVVFDGGVDLAYAAHDATVKDVNYTYVREYVSSGNCYDSYGHRRYNCEMYDTRLLGSEVVAVYPGDNASGLGPVIYGGAQFYFGQNKTWGLRVGVTRNQFGFPSARGTGFEIGLVRRPQRD